MDEIEILIRARYPILYLVTWEEERAEERLISIARKMGKKTFCWSVNRGLTEPGLNLQSKKKASSETSDPLAALNEVVEMLEPSLFIFKDFHPYLTDPAVVRRLRELSTYLKNSYKTLVFVSPKLSIPCELEKDITVVDFPLPDYADIEKLLGDVCGQVGGHQNLKVDLDKDSREKLIKAALGLTLKEAENVIARTLVTRGALDAEAVKVILTEKKQLIRKSGILEYYDHEEGLENLGGLEELKDWLLKRNTAFTEKAREFGLPSPRGVLLLGVQGCGKSLTAKTVAALWRQPLLRLDMGSIFAGLVGSSEENMRKAIKTAESIAPAILWVDEIEKAFSGTQSSGQSDAGTTSRVFGTFLTWLQEKKKPVFVIATANNISQLPPELLRKGRLDEIFFVDLPSAAERTEIFKIRYRQEGSQPGPLRDRRLGRCQRGLQRLGDRAGGHLRPLRRLRPGAGPGTPGLASGPQGNGALVPHHERADRNHAAMGIRQGPPRIERRCPMSVFFLVTGSPASFSWCLLSPRSNRACRSRSAQA